MNKQHLRPDEATLRKVVDGLLANHSCKVIEFESTTPLRSRRDQSGFAECKVRLSSGAAFLVKVGKSLVEYKRMHMAFNKAIPALGVKVVHQGKIDGWDAVATEYFDGIPLDRLVAGRSVSLERAASIASEAYALLEATSMPSSIESMERELYEILEKVKTCPQFNALDISVLGERLWPRLLNEFSNDNPKRSWTNGDFIARNLLLNERGEFKLIDYEYTTFTHFLWLEIIRWRHFSGSASLNGVASHLDGRFRPTAAKMALFFVEQIIRDTTSMGVLASSRCVSLNAQKLREQISRLDCDFSTSRVLSNGTPTRGKSSEFLTGAQLFWSNDGRFHERDSAKFEVKFDARTEASIRTSALAEPEVFFRLDVCESEAFVEIEEIRIYAGGNRLLYRAGAEPGWEGIVSGGNAKLVYRGERLCVLSLGEDPFLKFPPIKLPECVRGKELLVKCDLTVHSDLEKARQYLDLSLDLRYEAQLVRLRKEVEEREDSLRQANTDIEVLRVQLDEMHNTLRSTTEDISAKAAEISGLVRIRAELELEVKDLVNTNKDLSGAKAVLEAEVRTSLEDRKELEKALAAEADRRSAEISVYERDTRREKLEIKKALRRIAMAEQQVAEVRAQLVKEAEVRALVEQRAQERLDHLQRQAEENVRKIEQQLKAVRERRGDLLLGLEGVAGRFDVNTDAIGRKVPGASIGKKKRHFGGAIGNLRAWIGHNSINMYNHRFFREAKLLGESGLFFYDWYLRSNPDVQEKGVDPLSHFLAFGWKEKRNPNPLFDIDFYLSSYPDVEQAGMNPMVHYLNHGSKEGRSPNPLFDADWYLREYPDVNERSLDPLQHYLEHGSHEGRQPNSLFLTDWYRREYGTDVEEDNPLYDYLVKGWKIGRRPNPLFDSAWYLSRCPTLLKHGVNPLQHYRKCGFREGRLPSPDFDPETYRSRYELALNEDPLSHYLESCRRNNAKILPIREGEAASRIQSELKRLTTLGAPLSWDSRIEVLKSLQGKLDPIYKMPPSLREGCWRHVDGQRLSFSVIMPTWNRRDFIQRAIDSVLSQSYSAREILICDDGSEDDTLGLLETAYADAIDDGIIKILRVEHRGVAAARNCGLAHATSDLIAYLDSDNCWEPDYLLAQCSLYSCSDELNCSYTSLHSLNEDTGDHMLRSVKYDRKRLLDWNFIDLNAFVHRRVLFELCGGFDESLTRLVDWEFILRCTKNNVPAFFPYVGVRYFLSARKYKNITFTEDLETNRKAVLSRIVRERVKYGLEVLRLAYVLWDFPALSQTFVLLELAWLVRNGYDVKVYYHVSPDASAKLKFEVASYRVENTEELSELMRRHCRNFCHSHFAYPAVTLLAYPACRKLGLPFTFMPHAVDIFHQSNDKRNNIGEISRDPLCLKVFVHGSFHQSFLEDRGVPRGKIAHMLQAFDSQAFEAVSPSLDCDAPTPDRVAPKAVFVGRFVEKKGLGTLLDALSLLPRDDLRLELYGYGPEEERLRKQALTLGLTNVHFMGALEGAEAVCNCLRDATFFVMPCLRAQNGDMDGFPTVLLEAMAMGVPVLTTTVSAIPDYLCDGRDAILVEPGDVEALVTGIKRILSIMGDHRRALIDNARALVFERAGVEKTMQRLVDEWNEYTVDIFLVTFNQSNESDSLETQEILRRVLEFTSTPFTLTIVDNASSEESVSRIIAQLKGRSNVRYIRLRKNVMCGPASNIALQHATSEFAIYLCSKEAYVSRPSWERSMVEFMRMNRDVALGGHGSHLPKATYGSEYPSLSMFPHYRNKYYAMTNPDRIFYHVQGGSYILRRQVFLEHGGFNKEVPHHETDVELSYFYESLGYRLGKIAGVQSVTTKTLPRIAATIDEHTIVAHPMTLDNAFLLSEVPTRVDGVRCPICQWSGDSFKFEGGGESLCPSCSSTSFSRFSFKLLARDHRTYRNCNALLLSADASLAEGLSTMFKIVDTLPFAELRKMTALHVDDREYAVIIFDADGMLADGVGPYWPFVYRRLSLDGCFLFKAGGKRPKNTRGLASSGAIPRYDIDYKQGRSVFHGCQSEVVATVDLTLPPTY